MHIKIAWAIITIKKWLRHFFRGGRGRFERGFREPRRGTKTGKHTGNQDGEHVQGTKTGNQDGEPRRGTKTGNKDMEQRRGTKTGNQDRSENSPKIVRK